MIRNYFRTAVRSLLKHKVFSMINIMGLAIGIASCILIGGYIHHELSYDRFHENADRIYRIAWQGEVPQTRTPHPMSYDLVKDLPQVEAAVSLSPIWGPGLTKPTFAVKYGENIFEEKGFLSADTTFFKVFNFPFVEGNAETALRNPMSIVITREMAKKYFSGGDAVGKTLNINGDTDLLVSAVLEDIPQAAHFHFDFLIPYTLLKARETGGYYTWDDFGHYNYVLLSPDADAEALEAFLPEWSDTYRNWSDRAKELFAEGAIAFDLQPLTDIHLYSHLRWELESNSHITYLYILGAAALFILIIGCVNFMNLTTARSMERAKEIGMRKTLGATRKQLVGQFLGEAMLYSFLGIVGAIFLVDLMLPVFEQMIGKSFDLRFMKWVPGLIGLMVGVGILAGAYPAFFLSSLQPLKGLRGKFTHSQQGSRFRKVLVVFQFSISTALIAGTLIAFQQLNFMQHADLGFDKSQILVVPIHSEEMAERYKTVKESWNENTGILGVTAISNVPGENFNQHEMQWRESDPAVNMSELSIDEDFFHVMGLEMQAGRPLSDVFGRDSAFAFVLNESGAKQFDWETPVGEQLTWLDDNEDFKGQVVGVVKNFNFRSLHESIGPLIFRMAPGDFNNFLIKVEAKDLETTLIGLESIWQKFEPQRPFSYRFLDEEFGALYVAEERMSTSLGVFTLLAIFVAGLGLFGLASFTAEKRTREIGIRKIMGASPWQIVTMLTGDLLNLILLALILAVPFAWWGMEQWLEEFAFRINLSPVVFVAAGLVTLAVSLLTIGIQAFRAANVNPADILRSE